jgi:hypothetical protein
MPLVRFESLLTGSFCSHRTCRPQRLSASSIASPKGRVTSATLTSESGGAPSEPAADSSRASEETHGDSTNRIEALLESVLENTRARAPSYKRRCSNRRILEPRSSATPPISRASVPVPRRGRAQNACVSGECSGALLRAHCLRLAPKSSSTQLARIRALRLTYEPSFPGVPSPTTSLRCGQRPAPGLPHPAPLRLQVFSTS